MSTNFIHLADKILQIEKLLSINARSSCFYIRYPYILEIRYKQPSKYYEVNTSLEILEFKGYKEYTDMSCKFQTKDEIKKFLDIVKVKASNCNISDNIK